ncbi:MAG: anaerobic glycerol-3-phosphate dehydrogenase subunit B [Desulfobacterales bacterium]|nr:anaerobic glycerol-3-phosphate dehydrogenase subunit B [Desulfobacterales bacterium]
MSDSSTNTCDLLVIGSGVTGMAGALYAANRGVSTIQVGGPGELTFASGLLDLMGVHPIQEKKQWEDPWAAIDAIARDMPGHPYAKLEKEWIRTALDELFSFLEKGGLPYCRRPERNIDVLTPAGTLKRTYAAPQTMWKGVEAHEKKRPCLLVSVEGLKEFSARQIFAIQKDRWPDLRTDRVAFPDSEKLDEVHVEHMARSLAMPETREKLAAAVRPLVKKGEIVGMPAFLGIFNTREVMAHLEKVIGAPLFEIPTMPPSVPGIRLKETFERDLPTLGVRIFPQKTVTEVVAEKEGGFVATISGGIFESTVRARGILLATGRFLGKGLSGDRERIRETVFDLPVHQPANREQWHRHDFLDPRGHPLNQAGLVTDNLFRPLDESGKPAHPALHAAGSILAHQDWMRMKCGSGLAAATAYGAVRAFIQTL